MASLPFEQLLHGLVAQHELQQAIIGDLRRENRLLRDQLGLSSPALDDDKPVGNGSVRMQKPLKPKSKQKALKPDHQIVPPLPLELLNEQRKQEKKPTALKADPAAFPARLPAPDKLDDEKRLIKKLTKNNHLVPVQFHRGPGRAILPQGVPKPSLEKRTTLPELPETPREVEGLRASGIGQEAASDSETRCRRFSVEDSYRSVCAALPDTHGEESDSALVGVSRNSRRRSGERPSLAAESSPAKSEGFAGSPKTLVNSMTLSEQAQQQHKSDVERNSSTQSLQSLQSLRYSESSSVYSPQCGRVAGSGQMAGLNLTFGADGSRASSKERRSHSKSAQSELEVIREGPMRSDGSGPLYTSSTDPAGTAVFMASGTEMGMVDSEASSLPMSEYSSAHWYGPPHATEGHAVTQLSYPMTDYASANVRTTAQSLGISDYPSAHMYESNRGSSETRAVINAPSGTMSDYPSAHMFEQSSEMGSFDQNVASAKQSLVMSDYSSANRFDTNGISQPQLTIDPLDIDNAAARLLSQFEQRQSQGRRISDTSVHYSSEDATAQYSSAMPNDEGDNSRGTPYRVSIRFNQEMSVHEFTDIRSEDPHKAPKAAKGVKAPLKGKAENRARFRSEDSCINPEGGPASGSSDEDSTPRSPPSPKPTRSRNQTLDLPHSRAPSTTSRRHSPRAGPQSSHCSHKSTKSAAHTATTTSGSEACTLVSTEVDRGSQLMMPELWPVWQEKGIQRHKSRRNCRAPVIFIECATGAPLYEEPEESRICQRFVLRPNSQTRLSWDIITIFMVGYDVITIPLVAFAFQQNTFLTTMDWVTSIFWTCDIPGSFLTGYHTEGIVEMRPRAIAKHYIKTWFVFDVSIILTDWFFLIMSIVSSNSQVDVAGLMRYGKTTRINRILRAMRLLRFMKLQRVLADVLDMVKSEYTQTLCNVGMAIGFIVTLNHYLACGWYFTGSVYMKDDLPNWIEGSKVEDGSDLYKYTTAIHWSLTQFTPAGMEVRPYNIAERLYSIVVLLFALITFSSFLGSITTAMTQLRKLRSEQAKQQALLRRYFLDNKVSTELGQRIWKFIKTTHFAHKSRTHTKDIAILKLLPTAIKNSLNEELFRPYVTRIPVFQHYVNMDSEGLNELVHKAVDEKAYTAGDELFASGQSSETTNAVYLVVSGWLDYKMVDRNDSSSVEMGGWACEHSIWLKWIHCGTLMAATSCECLLLHPGKTREILAKYPASLPFLRAYAKFFHNFIRARFEDGSCNFQSFLEAGGICDIWDDVDELQAVLRKAFAEIGEEFKAHFSENSSKDKGLSVMKSMSMLGRRMRFSGKDDY